MLITPKINSDLTKNNSLLSKQQQQVTYIYCTKYIVIPLFAGKPYAAGDKIFCIYKTSHDSLLFQHGKKEGFPITKIIEVNNVTSPQTATQSYLYKK